jgi:hypothetical protein
VISGFNTDIDFKGNVYHVQTEDKGAPLHMIMSLVYDGGTILASKRASYDELSAVGYDEKEIADRLSRQHKLMCAAVRAGRINELVAMTRAAAAERAKPKSEPMLSTADAVRLAESLGETADVVSAPAAPPRREAVRPSAPGASGVATAEPQPLIRVVPEAIFEDELVIDAIHIIEDDEIEILPAEAVAVVSDVPGHSELSGRERPVNQKLSLELLSDARFKGGDRRTVNVMICRGTDRRVVPDAQVMIKVLGSSFRPVIFHAKTDANGLARVHLQLPHFQSGRAAVLIRAITDGEEIELRRVVTPG